MARIIGLTVLFVFALVGCSSRPPVAKKKDIPPPPPPPTTTTPAAPKVETPKPEPPEAAKPDESVKKEEPKTEPAKPDEPTPAAPEEKKEEPKTEPKPASVKDAPLGPETGFEGEFVGGKTVRAWTQILDSEDKEKLTDAFEIFKMVGKRAAIAGPKLEALTKSADPEIAAGAREALQAVKTKE